MGKKPDKAVAMNKILSFLCDPSFECNFTVECVKSLRKRGRWRFTKGKTYLIKEVFKLENGEVHAYAVCNEDQDFSFALLTKDNYSYRFYDYFR